MRPGKLTSRGIQGFTRRRHFAAPLVIFALAFILQQVANSNPRLTEHYYSRLLYPQIAYGLALPGRLVGFSLAEALLFALLAMLAGWLVWQARQLYLRRQSWRALLLSLISGAAWLAAVAALTFVLVFGLNYQRVPLAENLELPRREATALEAEAISRAVVDGVNRNYEESRVASDELTGSRMPLTRPQLYEILEEAFGREPLLHDLSGGGFVRPKPVFFSGVMSGLGISGIYSPFTAEPQYNAIQPDSALPFNLAHEMAHQRGFARESEANFVAFLVCTRASHPYVRYSGYLGGMRVLSALFRLAPGRYREVYQTIGAGPRADLDASARFWMRYRGAASDLTRRLNNAYLKANGVRSGVKNYNEATSLIIGYYLKQSAGGAAFAD